jgi:hypothetical protein
MIAMHAVDIVYEPRLAARDAGQRPEAMATRKPMLLLRFDGSL